MWQVQYTRTFGRGRLFKSVLVGLALCIAAVSTAEAAKRQRLSVRAKAVHRVASGGDELIGAPRYAAIVIDDKTGKVLYAKNADAPRHPASLTKMMTLYILFEEMQKRKVSLSSRFAASAKASMQAPTKLGLRPGQTIAVEDAILALITKSANDVAVIVAENIGGTEEAFARRMTATARKIGMRGTSFYNASGLPNDAQFTTARDMVVLGRALQERFPVQYRYFATRSFTWGNAVHGNHNKLLYRLEGIDGIKTGYTNASGFNLVSSIRRDGRHVVAAVMGGSSGRARDDHMASLLAAHLPLASAGAKVSSVFRENGLRHSADAGEAFLDEVAVADAGVVEEPVRVAAPAPAPVAAARVEPTEVGAPMSLMAALPATQPSAPTIDHSKPRIAASDVVAIAPQHREMRPSADHGAAVAMARAILLPDAGKPMRPIAEAPARPASQMMAMAPVAHPAAGPMAVVAPETRAAKPMTLAEATISQRELAVATTGSIPRPKAEEPPLPKAAARAGWMVQIGAYDNDRAARAALDKARDRGGPVLARTEGFTEPATSGSGRVWRARFAGFADQKRAEDACTALKRKDLACLALRQ